MKKNFDLKIYWSWTRNKKIDKKCLTMLVERKLGIERKSKDIVQNQQLLPKIHLHTHMHTTIRVEENE